MRTNGRTNGRKHGGVRAFLRSPFLVGVSLVAVLAGLSWLAGESLTSSIGQLLIAPAEARKARMGPEPMVRPPVSVFKAPAFVATPIPGLGVRPPAAAYRAAAIGPPRLEPAVLPPAKALPPKHRGPGFQPAKRAKGKGLRDTIKAGAREPPVASDAPMRRAASDFKGEGRAPVPLMATQVARRYAVFNRALEKLSKRSRRLKKDTTTASLPAEKKRDNAVADAGGAKQKRRLGGRLVGELLPPIGSFNANEVLALNLTAEELGKVRNAGYEPIANIELPEFGLTITRLKTPGV